jgi:hypothetical protein
MIGTSSFQLLNGDHPKRGQDSELNLQRQNVFVADADFVARYCIKVTPASRLIVM